jgi:hypothetical protein
MTSSAIMQPSLFEPIVPVPDASKLTIQAAFEEFDRLNPWVRRQLVRLARDLVARGHTRLGMGGLFEVLRWQVQMSTKDPSSKFKLNNSYRSRYTRKIEQECPDLRGLFEKRMLHAN